MRLRRALAPLALVSTATSLSMPVTADAAAPAIKLAGWQADYQGTSVADTPVTQAKLNGEYITLTNTTTRAIGIGGYRVIDDGAKHVYVVPRGFTLGAKKSVVIRSGQGSNTSSTLYWGQAVRGLKPASRNSFVWNNSTDKATLKNAAGVTVHTCTYTRTKSGFKAC